MFVHVSHSLKNDNLHLELLVQPLVVCCVIIWTVQEIK